MQNMRTPKMETVCDKHVGIYYYLVIFSEISALVEGRKSDSLLLGAGVDALLFL